jgi:hypothetical protein
MDESIPFYFGPFGGAAFDVIGSRVHPEVSQTNSVRATEEKAG